MTEPQPIAIKLKITDKSAIESDNSVFITCQQNNIGYFQSMPPGRPKRLSAGQRPPFSWIGGALCLDFVNSVSWRAPGNLENERFRTPADLADWAVAAGLWQEPGLFDERTLSLAHDLRRGLHELLLRISSNETPRVDEVEWLNRWIQDSRHHLRLLPSSEDCGWAWTAEHPGTSPDRRTAMLAVVVQSAVDLLRSPDRLLLRACANERCGWLFLDRSRKHNRRWCEMRECGGRAKARRYQSRRRERSAQPPNG